MKKVCILANDEKGNKFEKEISFEGKKGKERILIGNGFENYYMDTLFNNKDGLNMKKNNLLCIDAAGRNHLGSTVWIENKLILELKEVQDYINSNNLKIM